MIRVLATGAKTIKEIQRTVTDASPNGVQSVVYALVASGEVMKDDSTPKKFSAADGHKTNGAKRSATLSRTNLHLTHGVTFGQGQCIDGSR